MFPLLLLPSVIMALVSNRIYAANTVVKHFLIWNVREMKSTAPNNSVRINLCAINYRSLQSFFADFNRLNAINLLTVVCFWVLNVVYEVMEA